MAKRTGIVMPDEDYVEMNTAELEYSGGSQQAKAEAQTAGVTQDDNSSSFKEIALGLAPSIGQLAMMYFMFGGARAPQGPQGGQGGEVAKNVCKPPGGQKIQPKNNSIIKNNDIPNSLNSSFASFDNELIIN